MMLEEELLEALAELGLTRRESYVYVLLLRRGPSAVSEMLEHINVHQPQLYNILKNLIRKGFVKVIDGRPKMYAANDPEVIVERKEAELRKCRKLIKELAKERNEQKESAVWVARNREGLIRNAIEMIKRSKNELYVELPTHLADQLVESVADAIRRGVRVYLLFFPRAPSPVVKTLSNAGRNLNVKEKALGQFFLLISDMSSCIYAPRRYFVGGRGGEDVYAVLFKEREMAFFFMHHFFEAWRRARTVLAEELIPSLYPRTFTSHRMAVDEILRLMNKGFKVVVEVEGKEVRGDRKLRLSGEVDSVTVTSEVVNFTLRVRKGEEVKVGGYNSEVEDVESEKITIVRVSKRS